MVSRHDGQAQAPECGLATSNRLGIRALTRAGALPNRDFAPTLPIAPAFGLLGAYFLYRGADVTAYILIAIGGSLLIAGAVAPSVLRPLNRAWMALGLLLGKVISPIVLGIIFFIVITPVSVLTRAFGRDELKLKRNGATTYWLERSPPGPESLSFTKQF